MVEKEDGYFYCGESADVEGFDDDVSLIVSVYMSKSPFAFLSQAKLTSVKDLGSATKMACLPAPKWVATQ